MPPYQETGYRMNERIKAVGRQAGLVFIEDGVYGQRWYSSKCGLDAAEYENLVKMIVRECMEQVFYTIEDEEQDNISGSIRDRITQHFGVDE
jgi:hypothetical protein